MSDPAVTYKVIILGNSSVGKTALIHRLHTGEFSVSTTATVGIDFHTHILKLDNGAEVNLQIWDTAGQERFRNITRSYYRGAHGIVFVYDVTNPQSFEEMSYWVNSVNDAVSNSMAGRGADEKRPVAILLGNKIDIEDAKAVQKSQGEDLRDRNTLYGFYEVSAKTGEGVEKAFNQLAFFLVDNYHTVLLKDPEALKRKSTVGSPTSKSRANSNPFAASSTGGGSHGGTEATLKLGAPSTTTSTAGPTTDKCKCL